MDEFYVGYRAQAPPALARRLRRVVVLLVAGGVALAALLALAQRPFDPGVFEFGAPGWLEGRLVEHPYPVLRTDGPGPGGGDSGSPGYLLVAEGKHGAGDQVAGLADRRVRLEGTRIYRDAHAMLEVVTGSVAALAGDDGSGATATALDDLGRHTLRGEIVDSKCFLGVMKPGRRKPHRACATRCISGGIPPAFFVETAAGERQLLLLVDAEGRPVNDRVLDLVAEPLEITGRVRRENGSLVLAADPATYRRLAG